MLKQVVFINKLDQLRVFPFCDEDVDYFVQLKTTSLLKLWFENYKDEVWQSDGLQSFVSELRNKLQQSIALNRRFEFLGWERR